MKRQKLVAKAEVWGLLSNLSIYAGAMAILIPNVTGTVLLVALVCAVATTMMHRRAENNLNNLSKVD